MEQIKPFIDPLSTITKTPLSTNPTTQAVRQNASPSSTNAIVIQFGGKVPIQVAESVWHVQFQSQGQNNAARPNDALYALLLPDQSVATLSTRQRSIEKVFVVKDKASEPNSSDQLHPIPSSIELAHSGTDSAAPLSTKKQALTREIGDQSQPQLPQIPTPSNFPKISNNFDKPPPTRLLLRINY